MREKPACSQRHRSSAGIDRAAEVRVGRTTGERDAIIVKFPTATPTATAEDRDLTSTSIAGRRTDGRDAVQRNTQMTKESFATPGSPEFIAELAAKSQELEDASPTDILRWAAERYAPGLTMGTAFGPEGMCLIHMLAHVAPQTTIFNLETGYQFPETLALVERVRERYGIVIQLERPDQTVEEYEKSHGGPLYKINPDQCCMDRKLRVLERVAKGKSAWISAIRRDQSPDRSVASIVGWDKKFGLVKVNPLVNWTKQDVWKLITQEKIPYNPLHDQGYTSIGCWPCTRSVLFGEDERAGRWSGTAKTECGLHKVD